MSKEKKISCIIISPSSNHTGSTLSLIRTVSDVSSVKFSVMLPDNKDLATHLEDKAVVLYGGYSQLTKKVSSLGRYFVGQLLGGYRLYKLIKSESPSLVHVNSVTVLFPGVVCYYLKVPVIYHIRETPVFYNKMIWGLYYFNIKIFSSFLLGCCENVIKPFEMLSSKIDSDYVYNWVGDDFVVRDSFSNNRDLKRFVIGSFAGSGKRKGLPDLLSMFSELVEKCDNVILRIANNKPKKKWFIDVYGSKWEKYYCLKSVEYLGVMDDVKSYLDNVDVFVTPSYAEAFPRSVLEAMARGCAVVASDVGGTNEIIEHSKNGFLFKPGDVALMMAYVSQLISDSKLFDTIVSNGVASIRLRFLSRDNACKIQNIYMSVLAKYTRD